jgi:hypothetical protein
VAVAWPVLKYHVWLLLLAALPWIAVVLWYVHGHVSTLARATWLGMLFVVCQGVIGAHLSNLFYDT